MMWWLLACGGGAPEPYVELPLPPEVPVVPVERPPDVILVSIDTLRPDHLGAYGHTRPTSPFIDGLAARGVRFARARSSSPWTLPAHVTMLTGRLPTSHYVVADALRLSDDVPVLPERLAARGVATGAAVATYFVSSRYRFDRGFDHFQDFGINDKKQNLAGLVDTARVVDDLVAWARSVPADQPLFVLLHTYDAHYAYDPPAPYETMFDRAPGPDDPKYRSYPFYKKNPLDAAQLEHQRAQYDEAIRYVDDQLARLAGVFAELGRSPRWVITSDHGEEFGERGSWGHGHTLYAEQLAIPLIVSGPGIPEGVVVERPVGNHDIAPTIAAWTGVGLVRPDGIDLTPYLDGATPPPERAFLAETSRHRTRRVSLLESGRRIEWDLASGAVEVFDPDDERRALAESGDGLRARATALLGRPWLADDALTVRSPKATLLHTQSGRVPAGGRFLAFPLHAELRAGGRVASAGGGDAGGLRWVGRERPVPIALDDDTRSALEALGYVQDDE